MILPAGSNRATQPHAAALHTAPKRKCVGTTASRRSCLHAVRVFCPIDQFAVPDPFLPTVSVSYCMLFVPVPVMVGLGCGYGAMLERGQTVGRGLFISWGEEGEWLPGHKRPTEFRRVCLHDPNSCQTPTMNASNSTISNTHEQAQRPILHTHPSMLIVVYAMQY